MYQIKAQSETFMQGSTLKFPLIIIKQPAPVLTPDQKVFNQLCARVKELEQKRDTLTHELDVCLRFYYDYIQPEEARWLQVVMQRVIITYQFYKTSDAFSKMELRAMRELIVSDLNEVYKHHEAGTVLEEIHAIYKAMYGIEHNNIPEDDLDIFDDDYPKQGPCKKYKKTKKQLKKEAEQAAQQEMQSKSFNMVYKQLARVFHPDLEQDVTQKPFKEELMKKLTSVHEKKDLHALLALEMEWLVNSSGQLQTKSDEQITLYNAMLRDQIKKLEKSIEALSFDAKYYPMYRFLVNESHDLESLTLQCELLQLDIQAVQENLRKLQAQGASFLKAVLV